MQARRFRHFRGTKPPFPKTNVFTTLIELFSQIALVMDTRFVKTVYFLFVMSVVEWLIELAPKQGTRVVGSDEILLSGKKHELTLVLS